MAENGHHEAPIHWSLLDEDLSIDGLLGISHSPSATKEKAA